MNITRVQKSEIFILLSLIIITASIFGMLWLGSADHANMETCPVSSSSVGCSSVADSIIMSVHHIAGLQSMTTTVISYNTILLALFASLLFLGIFFIKNILDTQLNVPKTWNVYDFNVLPKEKLLFWLVLVNRLNPHSLSVVRSNI